MQKILFLLLGVLGLAGSALSQTYILSGAIADTAGTPIPYVTVTLLDPKDSTLAHFGISTPKGTVELKDVAAGSYLLQIAHAGHQTLYRQWTIPSSGLSFGVIQLAIRSLNLNEVSVVAERVPIAFNKDTLEYNAGAFKVRPDATVEDLLKKLPGVQVNRNGDIEAQGKAVNKVLVDGKEFFGNDPKMATRNLPADAIKKVQVYDGGSDQAAFSGIDDGQREKTINLSLKDNKKAGSFGDITAGGGSGDHYKGSAKWYRFRPKEQLAALGMLNNVNQFGFTLSDYMNFQGGLFNMGNSLRMNIRDAQTYPVDLGLPTAGATTSGAAGINFSREPRTRQRFNVNYLGNGADRRVDQNVYSRNSSDRGIYEQHQYNGEHSAYNAHRFNASWKDEHDSSRQWIFSGNGEWQTGQSTTNSASSAVMERILVNRLTGWQSSGNSSSTVNLRGSYQKKREGAWSVLRSSTEMRYALTPTRDEWRNHTEFITSGVQVNDDQYQQNRLLELSGSIVASAVRKLKGSLYLEPEWKFGSNQQHLIRAQGQLAAGETRIDSLSFDFRRDYYFARTGLGLQRNRTRSQLHLAMNVEGGALKPTLVTEAGSQTNRLFLLPEFDWNFQPKSGTNLSVDWNSEVEVPDVEQLIPVVSYRSPLNMRYGNPDLSPAWANRVSAHYSRFDQFSFRFYSLHANASYVKDAVGNNLYIRPDLSQVLTYVNVPYRARVRVGGTFNTPIRPLGLTVSTRLSDGWDQGIGYVNAVQNVQTSWSHELELSLENRKKKVLDWQVGGSVQITDAHYSVNTALDNRYYRFSGFSQVSIQPTDRLFIGVTGDLNYYTASNFPDAVWVPLLKSEVSYSVLRSKRGSVILEGYDLLNRNTGIQRTSQQNQLIETRSNIIGRYFLLSFRYKLNKFGGETGPKMRVQNIRE